MWIPIVMCVAALTSNVCPYMTILPTNVTYATEAECRAYASASQGVYQVITCLNV